jgi:hypothetical protein
MKTVTVAFKAPGERAEARTIPDTLPAMQGLVAGYLEALPFAGYDLWLNEEGKLKGMAPNIVLLEQQDIAVGPVFVARSNANGDTVSLRPDENPAVLAKLDQFALTPGQDFGWLLP